MLMRMCATNFDVDALRGVYDNMVANKCASSESPECLVKLELTFCELKSELSDQSRTAKLWIQYR